MRLRLLAVLSAVATLGAGTGCAHRTPAAAAAGSPQEFVVYVFNKSATRSVPVTISVDGVCVEDRDYAPLVGSKGRGEIRLRLPRGVHHVRARVANLTAETDVDLDHFMCQVIYYDATTDPRERVGAGAPSLTVEQIGWC